MRLNKTLFSFLTCSLFFALAFQAQAFYVEIPKSMSDNFNKLKNSIVRPQVLGESVSSDYGGMSMQQPVEVQKEEIKTCNVNGVETPGACENYSVKQDQYYNENDYGKEKEDEERRRQDEERQKKDQERWMNDMKRGMRDMDRNFARLSSAFKKAEKSGTIIPQEIKDKFAQANEIMNALKNAQTAEEMQNIDMQGFGDLMRELDEAREVLIDQVQRLKDMKRGLKDLARELSKFESQAAKLAKQKIAVPENLSEILNKLKSTVAAIQNAKTLEEAQAAGIEDMRELWETLDENRRQLEMLSRWPQTLQEIDKQLKQLAQTLQQAKKAVDKAKKSGIDISDIYAEFESAVNKLKSAKAEAMRKMAESDGEAAFEIIENDFFNQTEDVWSKQRIIFTFSDLGKFKADFKRGLGDSHRLMQQLKRKKIDVSELEKLIVYATAKGNEVEKMLKSKPVDLDGVLDLLNELEDLRQEFYEIADELSGGENLKPWEQGPILFKTPELPDSVSKIMSKDKCDCKCGEAKQQE